MVVSNEIRLPHAGVAISVAFARGTGTLPVGFESRMMGAHYHPPRGPPLLLTVNTAGTASNPVAAPSLVVVPPSCLNIPISPVLTLKVFTGMCLLIDLEVLIENFEVEAKIPYHRLTQG